MAYPVEPGNDLLQGRQKRPSIVVIIKNILASISARGDVIESIGKFYADGAGHDGRNITEIALLT